VVHELLLLWFPPCSFEAVGVHDGVIHVTILMPCLNDADTAAELVVESASQLQAAGFESSFLVVDDGSQPPLLEGLSKQLAGAGLRDGAVRVLELKRNLGHQRAIACGLCQLSAEPAVSRVVVVMDSDGEDRPEDVPRLLNAVVAAGPRPAVAFAERTRRTEGFVFWLGYMAYLSLHRLLVGHAPRIGNFSALPASLLEGIVTDPDLWSHYAATQWKSRLKKVLVPLARGKRRRGSSHLGLGGLVLHGLSAISCYRETLALRLLIGCAVLLAGAVAAFVASLAAPTWEQAVLAAGLAVGVMLSLSLLAFGQCFLVMQSRHQSTVLPIKDYLPYVRAVTILEPSAGCPAEKNVKTNLK
jgi:hypothetical protein